MIFPEENQQQKTDIFTNEGIRHISAFSETLKRIHIRLINEGYIIKNGIIMKPVIDLPQNQQSVKIEV